MTQPLLAAAGARTGNRLLKPSQSVAATARHTAERSLNAKAAPPPSITAPRDRRSVWMITLVVAALVVTASFAARHVLIVPKVEPAVISEQPPQPLAAPVAVIAPAPVSTPMTTPALPALAADAADKSALTQDSSAATRIDAAKRAAARPRTTPAEVTPPPADPAPIVQTLAVAPAVAPAAPREAPRPDPWQAMNDTLARCAGGVFDRIVCDQRVRAQFCDGQWGQVPQCPSRAPNDHGQ